MEYESFKENLLAELRDFYGEDADVITVKDIEDDRRKACEEIQILLHQEAGNNGILTVNISALYEKFAMGNMDICDCMEFIYRELEGRINSEAGKVIERGTDGNVKEKGREI